MKTKYFIYKQNGNYDAGKSFKTQQLAEKHAQINNIRDYEIRAVIHMTR